MASLTVKKADNTTDIVYDALSAAGGDGSPAVWRQDTGGTAALPVGLRKLFTMFTKWNGPKTARQANFSFTYPYVVQDSTTTLYTAKDKVVFSGIVTLPSAIPQATLDEAAAQFANLLATSLVRSAVASGYAPN